MSTSLDDYFVDAKQPVIGSYLDVGILVFNRTSLHLVSGFCPDSDGRIIFTRKVTFALQPALPSSAEIKSILTNEIGSRVALVGLKHVFIVEMPNDLWGRLSVCSASLGEHVLSNYFCRCVLIGSSVQPSSHSYNIVKARWYIKEYQETGSKVNKIALLYTDNVIRIFDTADVAEVPILKIDFRPVLSGLEFDPTFQNSFGFHNRIASFDFGPCVEIEFEDAIFNTIFAVDGENNNVFIVAFRFDTLRTLSPCGPFQLTPNGVETASVETCDFFYVRHRSSRLLSVFALISTNGVLSHFVAVPLDEVFVEGQISYDFFIYDKLQLPEGPASSSDYTVIDDPLESGRYLLHSGWNAFSINVIPWLNTLIKSFDADLMSEPNRMKETHINHVFSIVSGELDLDVTKDLFLTSVASSFIRCEDSRFASSSKSLCGSEKRVLVAAVTGDGCMLTKVILYEPLDIAAASSGRLNNLAASFPSLEMRFKDIFSRRVSIPKLRLSRTMGEKEGLSASLKVMEGLMANLLLIKSAYKVVQASVSSALEESEKLGKKELNHNERLLGIVSEFMNLKNRIYAIHEAIGKQKTKMDQVCGLFAARMFPISEAEIAMRKTLEDMDASVRNHLTQMPVLANEVALERRRRFGATKSFQSSVNAKKFMLSKSTDDIEDLMNWVKQLSRRIDQLKEKSIKNPSETSSSRPVTPADSLRSLEKPRPLRTSTPLRGNLD